MVFRGTSIRGAVVVAALAAAIGPVGSGQAAGEDGGERTARDAAPYCGTECRGLGIEKVKAGDEHCGLLSRERKDTALDAACALAETHRRELQKKAEERASDKCGAVRERKGCRCRGELRRWQNVYTHVLSQRCWTECGWAYLIGCERRPEGDGGGDEPDPAC